MSGKVWHTYQTTLRNENSEEMKIDLDHSGGYTKIDVEVFLDEEGKQRSRITFTLDELREVLALAERFENSTKVMKGEKNHDEI